MLMDVDSVRSEIKRSAAFRRPSIGAKRANAVANVRRRSARRPASAVNELTLTNAPFGIVRGKTGGLARAPPPLPEPTNHKPSRHSLRLFWREQVVCTTVNVARTPQRGAVVASATTRFQRDDLST
ncbi:hypothetical protein B5X24_HaOG212681 [Helicoverpa armigera]|nr:hypothetical protein B5X24_HaOG212681 [Helicoverpa armigera]